jgi:K+-sensing histidine kinase KdpD
MTPFKSRILIHNPSVFQRVAVVLTAVGAASVIRYLLELSLPKGLPFLTFFPAIMVSAWYGGVWPGLLSTVLSSIIAWNFWLSQPKSFSDFLATGSFMLVGLLMSLFTEQLHQAQRKVTQYTQNLERQIAERKKIEEDLRRKEEELIEAQNITHIGNWYLEAETGIVTASKEARLIQGIDPDKPYPKFREENRDLYTLTKDSWDTAVKAVEKALATGTGFEMDLEARHPDGKIIWFTTRAMAVFNAQCR